jgi:ribosomal subunit interface protein
MTLRISGKNMDVGEALRAQVKERIEAALAKYLDGASGSGHITFTPDGTGFRAYCVLHISSGITLEAHGAGYEATLAFSQAAERMEKRLRRYKRRLREDHPRSRTARHHAYSDGGEVAAARHTKKSDVSDDFMEMSSYIIDPVKDEDIESAEFHPVIVAETTSELHRYSISDAVVELDMTGLPVVVFRHAVNGRINIVYRRRDGSVGWIDPPVEAHQEAAE